MTANQTNAYLQAQVDFLFRLQNKRTMSQEERIAFLERKDFKPQYDYFTLWCGCRVFRNDDRMPCHRHTVGAHQGTTVGLTLPVLAEQAHAKDGT